MNLPRLDEITLLLLFSLVSLLRTHLYPSHRQIFISNGRPEDDAVDRHKFSLARTETCKDQTTQGSRESLTATKVAFDVRWEKLRSPEVNRL